MRKTIFMAGAILLAAGALVACAPLAVINAVSPGGASVATNAIRYGSDPRNSLDIYRPKAGDGPAPVIVFFYGGNWVSGKRSN